MKDGRNRVRWSSLWVSCLGVLAFSGCLSGDDSGGDPPENVRTGPGIQDEADAETCNRAAQRLVTCNVYSATGGLCDPGDTDDLDDEAVCAQRCVLAASCESLNDFICALASERMASADDPFLKCVRECVEADKVACASGGETYQSDERCDGEPECRDGSDEADCPTFTCEGGDELLERYVCDGSNDCAQGDDEARCPTHACNDGGAVPAERRCDGDPDCADGSDEAGCPERGVPLCDGMPVDREAR